MASVGLEQPTNSSAILPNSQTGGANSGAPDDEAKHGDRRINQSLGTALALIADLPLSRDEKAEAVRRLLADGGGKQ